MKKDINLNNVIGASESQTIEWKPSLSQMSDIIETVTAFANTNGGKLFVGVSNNGKVCGVTVGKATVETLSNKLAQHTEPKIQPSITIKKIAGKQVIVIEVNPSRDKLVLADGRPYKRVGPSTRRMGKHEYEQLILDKHKTQVNFDSESCKGATLKDIDWDFVKEFFVPLYEDVIKKKTSGSPQKVLESLGCIQKGKPTNAGMLLFGKEPQKFFMNAYIALARYKGKEVGTERLDYKEFTGSILKQIDDCDHYLKEHMAVMSRQDPLKIQRDDMPEYGIFSIRELITNTICHRDYANQNTKIIIKMFDDSIEFYNPGGLPKPITPKNITKKQFSRNPTIAKVLAKILYIEELGEGWDKIIDEHKKHKLKPNLPSIEADNYSTMVTIYSSKNKFTKQLDKEKVDSLVLNPRQKKALEYVKTKGSIKRSEYMKLGKVSHKTAHLELKKMVEGGVFVQKGSGPSTRYELYLT